MSNPLIPKYVFDTIYEIQPEKLYQEGVRGLLIDLDGTMASSRSVLPPEAVRPFLHHFLEVGIKVLVLSNNNEHRVAIFCKPLEVPHLSRAYKPFRKGFQAGADLLRVPLSQCAVVGDQIFTDTFGGNLAHAAVTCYVKSIDLRHFWIRARHQLERPFVAWGRKRMRKERDG